MARLLTMLRADRRGVTAIEYGLIAALVAVVVIGAVTALGLDVSATFGSASAEL